MHLCVEVIGMMDAKFTENEIFPYIVYLKCLLKFNLELVLHEAHFYCIYDQFK